MALSRLCSNDTFKTTPLRTQEECSNAVTSHNVKERNTASMPCFSILSCALHVHHRCGGASRDRTGDPLLAKQVLSQLSYGPLVFAWSLWTVVGLGGLEPPASPLSGVRSNHLSYRPSAGVRWSWQSPRSRVNLLGITSCLVWALETDIC